VPKLSKAAVKHTENFVHTQGGVRLIQTTDHNRQDGDGKENSRKFQGEELDAEGT
jgi:hypothetical protein